jgi:hypothetical protein
MEMRYKVYNGKELIFTAVTDLPDIADAVAIAALKRTARRHFQEQYPAVDLEDSRIREEWEKEPTGAVRG